MDAKLLPLATFVFEKLDELMNQYLKTLSVRAIVTTMCVATMPAAAASLSLSDAMEQLRTNSAQQLDYRTDSNTAYVMVRALGLDPLLTDNAGATAESRARGFLNQFGSVVGLTDAISELQLVRQSTDRAGNTHVHLDQVFNGIAVFGARLVVHMDDSGITGMSGAFIPGLEALAGVSVLPTSALERAALNRVSKQFGTDSLSVESSRPIYYRDGLLQGYEGDDYRAHEVIVRNDDAANPIRQRVILDATTGAALNQINEIHTVLNREIYTPNQDVPPITTEGSATAPADIALVGDQVSDPTSRAPRLPQDNLYIFAGGTYELYANLFGREGYDDGATRAEEQVQKSVYLINDQCPNAYWNGDSTNYCPGFDADDIVSHEWSHAYTEYTHGLIYQYQSGALNEAYSDIFGETYDLVNGIEGPLGVTLTEGEYFENGGSRWVLGEDLSEAAAGLLLRDMWDPDNFGANVPVLGIPVLSTPSPGSVITSSNYFCGSSDGGGVHTNSGVPNHAYAMLVDGKEFNGIEIPAIGMTRAAHIYFHAMTNYQVPSTNFAQHADALAQSCLDLMGVPLNDVLGNASPDVITSETCAAVEAAMLATEMRESPVEKCGYQPLLQPEDTTPAVCADGQSTVVDFDEGFNGTDIPAAWTTFDNVTGDTQEEGITWLISDDLPNSHAGGRAAFIANTFGGSCAPGGDISASFQLDSPEITVADDASTLSINHLMQSEFGFDGGNLKYSLNGADYAVVPAEAFTFNAYNTTLETGSGAIPDPVGLFSGGNTSPIAGEAAWSGSDEGASSSDWGTSLVSLSALGAASGDKISFRFEFGQDGCNGNLGWFVDQFTVSHCAAGSRNEPADPTTDSRSLTSRGGALGFLLLLPLMLVGLRRKVR